MKITYSGLLAYGLAALLVPVSGCLEIHVRTSISADGSSERVVSFKSGSQSLPDRAYPVPSDSSWALEWKETGEKDMKYEFTARKAFASPEDLVSEYARQPDTGSVKLSISLEKHFEWFYTYIDYRELYVFRNPFQRLPASGYFSPGEIETVRRGGDDDSLGKKVEEWDFRNVFEEFYARLIDGVGAGDSVVNRASLENAKGEMLRLVKRDTSKSDEAQVRNTLRLLAAALRAKDISRYEGVVAKVIADVDSMREKRKLDDHWISSVVMPGLLVGTNGEAVEGNEVRWKFEGMQLLVTDFPMEARSRVTNVWAFVVTGLAVLLILVPAILRLFRRTA